MNNFDFMISFPHPIEIEYVMRRDTHIVALWIIVNLTRPLLAKPKLVVEEVCDIYANGIKNCKEYTL